MKIIENFLSETERINLLNQVDWSDIGYTFQSSKSHNSFGVDQLSSEMLKIIQASGDIEYEIVEWWKYDSEYGISGGRHSDWDEAMYYDAGVKRHPEKTFIYYPNIENIVGGEIVIYKGQDEEILEKIIPQTNMLVYFDSHLEHEVLPLQKGKRVSIIFNPWKKSPDFTKFPYNPQGVNRKRASTIEEAIAYRKKMKESFKLNE